MNFFLCCLIGAAAGLLAAWGVGGGTLLLLAMTLFLQIGQRTAQCINLLFFLPTAAAALLYHRKNGYLRPALLKWAVPFALPAAAGAALLAARLDTGVLRIPFGGFLLLAGISLLWQSRGTAS